jgi:hypothetical protein
MPRKLRVEWEVPDELFDEQFREEDGQECKRRKRRSPQGGSR